MEIREIINQLNVKIIHGDFDVPGYVSISNDNSLTIVWISTRYSERMQHIALIHELEHVAKQKDETSLYHTSVQMRLKMENEVNCYMIDDLLDEYINVTGLEPKNINYITFMRQSGINLRYENFVKERLSKY